MKTVSGREFARSLERKGWAFARVSGSHHIYKAPTGLATVSVPIHNKDLRAGAQRALMQQTGLTDLFARNYEREQAPILKNLQPPSLLSQKTV